MIKLVCAFCKTEFERDSRYIKKEDQINSKHYFCSRYCVSKFGHSNETKEKIRKARFDYLKKKTGLTAQERKAKGELSYLEQQFLDNVIDRYELYKRHDIINEYPEYPYFIDFAFFDIKLAVELDGKCHFTNGKNRIDHDIKKDSALLQKGWSIFRIRYDENNEDKIVEFMKVLLSTNKSNPKIFGDLVYRRLPKTLRTSKKSVISKEEISKTSEKFRYKHFDICINCGDIISKGTKNKLCYKCWSDSRKKVDRPVLELLLKEINEMGYRAVGRIYGVSDNAIRNQLKSYQKNDTNIQIPKRKKKEVSDCTCGTTPIIIKNDSVRMYECPICKLSINRMSKDLFVARKSWNGLIKSIYKTKEDKRKYPILLCVCGTQPKLEKNMNGKSIVRCIECNKAVDHFSGSPADARKSWDRLIKRSISQKQ